MSTSLKFEQLTDSQKQNQKFLKDHFGLSAEEVGRCLFFREAGDIPWIPSDISMMIARKSGKILSIEPKDVKVIAQLRQVVVTAEAVDQDGRSFSRFGVATIGEQFGEIDIDATSLAESRAINAALNAAGFNPFKAGSAVELPARYTGPLSAEAKEHFQIEDQAALRNKDLRQIHAIAERKGLISGRNMASYQDWLHSYFGVRSAAVLDPATRASVIEQLVRWDASQDYLLEIPEHLRADAMIA